MINLKEKKSKGRVDAMSLPSKVVSTWKSVELMLAFHRDPKGKKRDKPVFWNPKGAFARLFADTKDQETILHLKAEGDSDADVMIQFRANKITARRNHPLGWSGIEIDDHSVSVVVNNVLITVKSDGSVTKREDAEITFLEADGSILKNTPWADILVSGDGGSISRRTEDHIDAFTPDGFVSKKRSRS